MTHNDDPRASQHLQSQAYLDFGHLSGPRGDAEVAEQVGG